MAGKRLVRRAAAVAAGIAAGTLLAATPAGAELSVSPAEGCKTRLIAELDREWRPRLQAALRTYTLSTEAAADYRRLRRELLDDTRYLGLFDATSKGALIAGQIFQSIKTTANLIEDLVGAIHPAGALTRGTRGYYYGLLKDGRTMHDVVTSGAEATVFKVVVDLNPAVSTIVNLAENVETSIRMEGGQKAFVGEMERQLARFDTAIAEAERKVRGAERDVEQYDLIRAAVLQYCDDTATAESESAAAAAGDDPLSAAKAKLGKLGRSYGTRTAEQWQQAGESLQPDQRRLRADTTAAARGFVRDADAIEGRTLDHMAAVAQATASAALQQIATRNAGLYGTAPAADCAEARRKIAAYDEWLAAARRTRHDFGHHRKFDPAIATVTRNRSAEVAAAQRMGCFG